MKTAKYGINQNSKTMTIKEEKLKNQKQQTNSEIEESTQSSESTMFRDALLRGDSSTERPVEQMEYENVEGAPFSIVGSEQKGYTIVIGTYCVKKETFKTMQEAKDYIATKPWELIFVGVNVFRDVIIKHRKKNK